MQPPDGLQVVGERVGSRLEDGGDVPLAALEVGGEHLDAAPWHRLTDRLDARGPDPGAAVGEVVPSHARQDHVSESHRLHCFGDPAWLVLVDGEGLRRHHVAEAAAAGAPVAQDQERGLPFFPALVDVRTARLLAHRVQRAGPHDPLEVGVVGPELRLDLQPVGSSRRADGLGAPDRVRRVGVIEGRNAALSVRAVRRDDWKVQAPAMRIVIADRHASQCSPRVEHEGRVLRREPALARRVRAGATPARPRPAPGRTRW